jgi:hypothetical protein
MIEKSRIIKTILKYAYPSRKGKLSAMRKVRDFTLIELLVVISIIVRLNVTKISKKC